MRSLCLQFLLLSHFIKNKVRIVRKKVYIYNQYFLTKYILANLNFSNFFLIYSLFFSLSKVFGSILWKIKREKIFNQDFFITF